MTAKNNYATNTDVTLTPSPPGNSGGTISVDAIIEDNNWVLVDSNATSIIRRAKDNTPIYFVINNKVSIPTVTKP